jgi:hypothetical protein
VPVLAAARSCSPGKHKLYCWAPDRESITTTQTRQGEAVMEKIDWEDVDLTFFSSWFRRWLLQRGVFPRWRGRSTGEDEEAAFYFFFYAGAGRVARVTMSRDSSHTVVGLKPIESRWA